MMLYNAQNYWFFWTFPSSGILKTRKQDINAQDYWVFCSFPSSGILETRKQDVSETGSVSILR
jgi:hypothetical protein